MVDYRRRKNKKGAKQRNYCVSAIDAGINGCIVPLVAFVSTLIKDGIILRGNPHIEAVDSLTIHVVGKFQADASAVSELRGLDTEKHAKQVHDFLIIGPGL